MRRCIIDASPIITLASAGYIRLLDPLYAQVMIPVAVAREVCPAGRDDPAARWMLANQKRIMPPLLAVDSQVAEWQLGAGESEVISGVLRDEGVEAVLDDRAARECAMSLGIKVRGTVGVVVLARKEGVIPAVAPVLDALRWVGLRVDDSLVAKALRMAGEAE